LISAEADDNSDNNSEKVQKQCRSAAGQLRQKDIKINLKIIGPTSLESLSQF